MLSRESVAGESVEEYVSELTADRLRQSVHECQLKSVSDIIRENRIDKIDLLKIDAEKSRAGHHQGHRRSATGPRSSRSCSRYTIRHAKRSSEIERLLIDKGIPLCRGAGDTARACGLVQSLCNAGSKSARRSMSDPAAAKPQPADRSSAARRRQLAAEHPGIRRRAALVHEATPRCRWSFASVPMTPVAEADAESEGGAE